MSGPEQRIEKIIRNKIYASNYWQSICIPLTLETILDEIVKLHDFGGTYGELKKPTKFITLLMKLIMLRPSKEIIYEFIKDDTFKYIRIIGAFYIRMMGNSKECYEWIEPLYYDYRPIKYRIDGKSYETITIDQFAWNLLHSDYYCDITLPLILPRPVLEEQKILSPRLSTIKQQYTSDQFKELLKTISLDD